jgi:hypothetical protein
MGASLRRYLKHLHQHSVAYTSLAVFRFLSWGKLKLKAALSGLFDTEDHWRLIVSFLHSSLEALHTNKRERSQLAKEGNMCIWI